MAWRHVIVTLPVFPCCYIEGGTLVLDNTSANNNIRISSRFLEFSGGNLTLLGVSGGATNESNNFTRRSGQTTGPVFGEGLNVFTVQAGTPWRDGLLPVRNAFLSGKPDGRAGARPSKNLPVPLRASEPACETFPLRPALRAPS